MLWNNSAKWGIVKQHRHGIVMPNILTVLHVCLLVGKGPLLLSDWHLVSLSRWQHLGNIAVAPCLRLIILSGCTGRGESRDGGSLCVRSSFYASSHAVATSGRRSGSTARCVGVGCSPRGPRVTMLRRSEPLHEGGHSNSFLWVKMCTYNKVYQAILTMKHGQYSSKKYQGECSEEGLWPKCVSNDWPLCLIRIYEQKHIDV